MTRILLFGRHGQLGSELCRKLAGFGPLTALGSGEVDFASPDAIRSAVRAIRPSVIVNAAAYTAVDKAESEPERAWAINALAPGVLAEEARPLGCLLVHYSSDYVFDGTKAGAYTEADSTNPLNVYGQTKLAGDRAIEASGCDHLILRTTWVYGPRGTNFLLTMLRLAREHAELRIVDDQTGAPTSSESIAAATAHILSQVLAPGSGGMEERSGIYNLTCAGATTWFGFAKAFLARVAESYGRPMPKLIPIPSSEFPRPAARPANSRLSCERIEQTFGVRMPAWEHALARVLDVLEQTAATDSMVK